MNERIVFGSIATVLIGVLIAITYHTQTNLFGFILITVTLALLAFYLLQFGTLGSFKMKALWTEATFIKEKRLEAQAGVEEIQQIQGRIKEHAETITGIVSRLQTTEQEVGESKNRIFEMESQIRQALEMAQPLKLTFAAGKTEKTEKGLKSLVYFRASKNEALGRLTFVVALPVGSTVKLTELRPSLEGGPYNSDGQQNYARPDGLSGEVSYIPMGAEVAVIEIVTSAATPIQIQSNKMPEPIVVNIEAPKVAS